MRDYWPFGFPALWLIGISGGYFGHDHWWAVFLAFLAWVLVMLAMLRAGYDPSSDGEG